MILRMLRKWLAPPSPPPAPSLYRELDPPSDGRMFGWQRTRGGARRPAMPVIVYDKRVGGGKEFVGDLHLLKPHEYGDDLDVLASRYPMPDVEMD
jgi:hypothetical protein